MAELRQRATGSAAASGFGSTQSVVLVLSAETFASSKIVNLLVTLQRNGQLGVLIFDEVGFACVYSFFF